MVRHAAFEDIPVCFSVMRLAKKGSPNYFDYTIDEEAAAEALKIRVMNPYSIILITEKNDGMLVGSAADSLRGHMMIGNEFFYAESEGLALIREYKKWGLRFGPETEINLDTSYGGAKSERAEKVLEHEGFKPIGTRMRFN